MTDKTPTERLRELLEERGVEWWEPDEYYKAGYITYWKANGMKWVAFECESGMFAINCSSLTDLTPEQAVDRTLGPGRCHISVHDNLAETDGMGDVWLECDACNWQMPLEPSTPRFNFCPNCGAEVLDE